MTCTDILGIRLHRSFSYTSGLARRGGVVRIKRDTYDEARRAIRDRLAEVGSHLTLIVLFRSL
ncbi:hypothetical protein BDV36DRAFT_44114 [Aspergillus pseudocaelatus]|uniref:Uncharacterized protein n=1 Tax=Aspergillus pseudocaelatus TaxID=1825620 RepID=A0ABQ6W7E1_9EURO|nr:hypothetical protein BDV36DRAFT_44114 [Aspergillus pseudocaelatus]